MWCRDGHLHKKSPGKGNTASIPTCCNCELMDTEEPNPSNYRGCTHAKDEMRKRKSQRAHRTATGRVISSSRTTPGLSFAVVQRSSLSRPQLHRAAPLPLRHNQQQVSSRSV
jgi:hypothetical protein